MIRFYNTGFLWLLPISLLPILIHLLSFKKSKVVRFSYTFLVEKIIKETSIKRKIVDIIILVLRCLIIFLLIIFISRPVIFYDPNKSGNINLLIAVDNSFSTRQKLFNSTKLEYFLDSVSKLLKNLTSNNVRVHIVSFNEKVNQINKNFEYIDEINYSEKNIKHTYRNTDLSCVINYSINLFNTFDKNSQNKVLIFTDLAKNIFFEKKELLHNKQNIDFLFCYPEINLGNSYFEKVEMSLYEKIFNIKFFPVVDKKFLPIMVQFYLLNNLVDFANIDFLKEKYEFNYVLGDDKKEIYGNLTLSQDNLNEDNNFYFYKKFFDNIKVGCFINEPVHYKGLNSIKYYIDKLSISGIEFNTFSYIILKEENKLNKMVANEYDGIIFVNLPDIKNLIEESLLNKKVVFFLSENIDYDSYEKLFKGIEFVGVEENKISKFNLVFGEDKDFNEFFSLFDIGNIDITKKYRLTLKDKNSNWKVLLKFNDGTPALISDGNIFLFSFTLSRDWSNLVYKPFFISFVKKVFSKDNQENKSVKNIYYTSEIIEVKNVIKIYDILLQKNVDTEYEITSDGIKIYKPGLYSIISNDNNNYKIAVNISPKESSTQLIEKEEINKYFKEIADISLSYINILREDYEKKILTWCFGKEYSEGIFFLVVVLFILEMILSRLSKRKI